MSSKTLTLNSLEPGDVTLRSITAADQENLRCWKNANRTSFFYKEVITPEMQARWFAGYLERDHDWMFIVHVSGADIGCMGFRLLGQGGATYADVYNVILGNAAYGKRGWMRQSLRLMCSYVASAHTPAITVQVLYHNPAVEWYRRTGFTDAVEHPDHLELELDLTQFKQCAFELAIS